MKALIFGGAVFFVAVIAAAALTAAGSADYQSKTEEQQQKILDNIASGFTSGFDARAGKFVEIKRIRADAATDLISVDLRFKDQRAENVAPQQIEGLRKELYGEYCNFFAGKVMLKNGIGLKMRIARPSGSQMTSLDFNETSCALHLKMAAN